MFLYVTRIFASHAWSKPSCKNLMNRGDIQILYPTHMKIK